MSPATSHARLFDYPAQATFGRALPKSKLYAFGKPTRRVRDLITTNVARITWQHKLAPETVNLPAKPAVPEIQVFSVALKPSVADGEVPEDILRCIDRAIGFPIIFELIATPDATGATAAPSAPARVRTVAAYKRPSEAAPSDKWVIGDYFASDWLPADTPRSPLPVALDLASLYEQMLRQLMPTPPRPGEPIQALAERQQRIAAKQRECRKLEAQLQRERQFNRKVEINAQLRQAQAELRALTE